jgi:hypothetical protein
VLVVRQDGHHGTNRYFVVNKVIHRHAKNVTRDVENVTPGVTPMSPEHIRNSGATPGSAQGVSPKLIHSTFDTAQGEAPPVETPQKQEPNYIPPRCLHNVSQSALKCNMCREAFLKGELA